MSNNILKKGSMIRLTNIETKDILNGIINNVRLKRDDVEDTELNLLNKPFEAELFPLNSSITYKELNEERTKKLNVGDRVLAIYDNDIDSFYKDEQKFSITKQDDDEDESSVISFDKYINMIYNNNNIEKDNGNQGNWFKGTIKEKNDNGTFKIKFGGVGNPTDIDIEFIRKLDDVYDINIITVITKDKDLTLDTFNRNRENQEKIIVEDSEKNKYEIVKEIKREIIAELTKLEEKMNKRKSERGAKTKYKLKWFYKTNYSGSKYFPLKISNVQQLSEANKYSQIDRYTKLKEGDLIKYNDPSHPNNGLLAKIIRIKNEDRNRRRYYDKKRYIYNIKFEPLETYIDPTELKQYQRKYENMITTLDNISESKILKFRYVEKSLYYPSSIEELIANPDKLDKFNDKYIVDTTLEKLKKNTIFIPDYVLAKYQPESKIRDMNKLIKPNNKNRYFIAHSPNIKKRPSGLYFEMKIPDGSEINNSKNEVEIDIYVDLQLNQSKMISQEEWDNKSLQGKLLDIFSDKIKNSYTGVFNCPSRFEKINLIVKNIMNKKFNVKPEDSETNLIKKSFYNTSKKIKEIKNRIKELEDKKTQYLNDIKEVPTNMAIDQIEIGKINTKIKNKKRELVEQEGIMKQKGCKKTKRRRKKYQKRKTKKKKYKKYKK